MKPIKAPMLLDVFRLTAPSEKQTVANIIRHKETPAGGFNYGRSATFTEKAYSGYRDFRALFSQCEGDGTSIAKVHNTKVLRLTAPLSQGRAIQTFPFPKRAITLAPGIQSSLGPKFFFVENGLVKLHYIHARNSFRASLKDFAGLGWAIKQEILDQDFFGQPSDVEFINVDKRDGTSSVEVYNLGDLLPHLKESPEKTIARFVKCLRHVDENSLAKERTRRKPKDKPSPQLDLGL